MRQTLNAAWTLAACAVLIAGCGRRDEPPPPDPRIAALIALPVPDYYATLRLAQRVSDGCPAYAFNERLSFETNEARNAIGTGSFSAVFQRATIDAATVAAEVRFQTQYNRRLDIDDLCPAALQEIAAETLLSALLIPRS